MTVNFVYPHSVSTIGGAEKMSIFAEDYLKSKGVAIIRSEYDAAIEADPDLVVFVGRQYAKIKRCLNFNIPTALIGYYSFYHTFSHVLKDKSQVQHVEEFMGLINHPYFTFICMTENDYHIAKVTCPQGHFVLGTNILPPVMKEEIPYASSVLLCARLCEQKNNIAVREVANLMPQTTFKLTDTVDVDEPWYAQSCHKKLDGIKNIKFVPPSKTVMEIPEYWWDNKCVILTSWYETMPLIIGEALSMGLPVVMYDVVTPDVHKLRNVTVVPQGYYHDMVHAIENVNPDHELVKEQYIEDKANYEAEFPHIGKAIYRLIK